MKQKRKGFTLVELLVVIAILAILATVSVVGYLSFTEKAKQSNDESLIAQLNTVLQGNEAIDGKPNTMYDALTQVKDSGFLVENLTPTSAKNEFLWNQEENRFVIVAADSLESTKNPSLWVIVNDETTLANLQDNYSVYLGSKYTDTDGIVNVANGFDAGDYDGITTINFATDANITVTIRTNGGTLNINAENATVHHYNSADTIDINRVAMDSYHEHGTIFGSLYINLGHVVVEEDASVNTIFVTTSNYDTNNQNVKVEDLTNNDILVVGTTKSASDNLEGIVLGSDNLANEVADVENTKLFSGGIGTEEFPYLINNEKDYRNIQKYTTTDSIVVYYKFINNIIIDAKDDSSFSTNSLVPQVTLTHNANFDLNGKTLGAVVNTIFENGRCGLILSVDGATLTISGNGTIDCECGDNEMYGINIINSGRVIVENGNFFGALTALQVTNGSLEIKDGYFDLAPTCKAQVPGYANYVVNCIDSSYKAGTATITISGGRFVKVDYSNNPEGQGTSYIADGYDVIKEVVDQEDVYVVVKK